MKPRLNLPYRRRRINQGPAPQRRTTFKKLLRLWPIITGVVVVTGWLLTNGQNAITTSEKAWVWWQIDHTYSGRWSNDSEGHIESPFWAARDGEKVVLALHVEGREATGDVHSERLCNYLPWQYVFIEGYRRWWGWAGVRIRAYDHIRGEKTMMGVFDLKYDRASKTMEMTSVTPSPLFPDRIQLVKVGENEYGSVSDEIEPFCPKAFGSTLPKTDRKSRSRKPVESLISAPTIAASAQRR